MDVAVYVVVGLVRSYIAGCSWDLKIEVAFALFLLLALIKRCAVARCRQLID
jgi:hypothetical protein